jgi:hypothetical protein
MIASGKLPRFFFAALVAAAVCLSCASTPKPQNPEPTAAPASPEAAPEPSPAVQPEPQAQPEPQPQPEPPAQPAAAKPFDPSSVTADVKNATFIDVRAFIESLNQIIRKQDYEAWLSNLTDEYIGYYSDPAILAQYSEYPIMKRNNIKLQTLKDYFIYVVYPSRQNDKVDDIEFVSETLIKAITVSPKGDRNILYMLEKHDDAWKIGIGR